MKPIKKSPVIAWITGLSYISKENYFYKKSLLSGEKEPMFP